MAHKKSGGTAKNGRDSNSQRLGIKLYGGQSVKAGQIIVRQCGTKFKNGFNTGLGKDYTIFSKIDGTVVFKNNVVHVVKEGKKLIPVY